MDDLALDFEHLSRNLPRLEDLSCLKSAFGARTFARLCSFLSTYFEGAAVYAWERALEQQLWESVAAVLFHKRCAEALFTQVRRGL